MKPLHLLAGAVVLCLAPAAPAARFTSAEVTRAINDVRVLLADGANSKADPGRRLSGGEGLFTGARSRAELTFPDDSIIRLGQHTTFSFTAGKREIDLRGGTLLIQQPRWRGRTELRTAAVSAAITGTTVMLETPREPDPGGVEKLLVIEGSLRFNLVAAPRQSMTLRAGEMVSFRSDARQLPEKQQFDIGRLLETSELAGRQFRPLPGLGAMAEAEAEQDEQKRRGRLLAAPLGRLPRGPFGIGILGGDPLNEAHEVRNRLPQPAPPPEPVAAPEPPDDPTPPPPPPPSDTDPRDPTGGGGNNNPGGDPFGGAGGPNGGTP